ncbi:tetratricopeptide repeat-containing sensor histidine kinase [Sphingobacterium hungaricum]|uniref:Oxygen sensor histidine kinase NreB n=1 Tax=Sphingobacterium hungaricum TaxID=2082723 RepID=A0A928UXC2_9SPHI|nr:sensor histidine kinase [Sphingobacterium hungaricum]MBE8714427.1 hypothetical protein [Sphingobacterium hungaricum]
MSKNLGLSIFCLLLLIGQGFGQSKEELKLHSDSQYRQVLLINNNEEKALALYDLSFFWSDYDTAKAKTFLEEATKELGNKAKSSYYQGVYKFYLAAIHFDVDPALAKQQYMEAEGFLKHVEDAYKSQATRYRARLWGSYGALLQRDGDAHAYVEVLLEKVIPMAKRISDTTLIGNNYQNVAMALMNLQEYAKADRFYDEALALLKGKRDSEEQQFTLFVNGARNSIQNKDFVRSRKLLDQAQEVLKSIPFSSYSPLYYAVEGSYWEKQQDFQKANSYFEKGIAAAKEQNNQDMVATILFDQSAAFQANKQPELARQKLLDVLPYVEQKPSLRNKQMVYYNLATTASQLGKDKEAVQWFEKYKIIADSIFLDKAEIRTLELEKKYRTAEKENEILRIDAENQQHQLALQRSRIVIGLLILASIILAMLSFIWYSSLKNKKKLAAQNELLLQEELRNTKQQEKLNLFNAMVQGQEKERSRIARDLHDGLGGMLASVKLKLSAVASKNEKQQEDSTMDLYTIINQLDHSVNELRRVARNMMPESLLYMGLEAALRDLCNAMAHSNLQIDFQASNMRSEYKQSFLIAVYRIVQELLTNAVKHSGASQVWVQCAETDGYFYITVEDNGLGFDAKKENVLSEGIGLSNIRNRVDILNGQLEIDAAEGKGASFHIQLQING